MTTRRRFFPGVALSMLFTIAVACGGADAPATTADGTTQTTNDPSGAESLDVCALLAPDEVEPYLGVRVDGSRGRMSCVWTNTATEESVTLTVQDGGTAASGRLLDASDYGETEEVSEVGGPARFAPGENIVEFIADDRRCEIQVAVLDDAKARAGGINLARLARERI